MDLIRNDLTSRVLAQSLDGLSLRAQTISNNVANIDTPNFKSSEVTFEQQLDAAINTQKDAGGLQMTITHAAHIDPNRPASLDQIKPATVQSVNTTLRNDGNNVDVDREMARLAETQLSFQASTQVLNEKLKLFREAVWEGKR